MGLEFWSGVAVGALTVLLPVLTVLAIRAADDPKSADVETLQDRLNRASKSRR